MLPESVFIYGFHCRRGIGGLMITFCENSYDIDQLLFGNLPGRQSDTTYIF